MFKNLTFLSRLIWIREGLNYVKVERQEDGIKLAKEVLYHLVDKETILFLSGGSTPKPLYQQIAKEGRLTPGAVALVDERYGEKMHDNSNEKMIEETKLFNLMKDKKTRVYKILEERSQEEASQDYDETLRYLLMHFKKSGAVLGIGKDGHTAGIAPDRVDFENPIFEESSLFVNYFNDEKGSFGQRITMTFPALTMLDFMIVLAFGEEKKKALSKMFEEGSVREIPARFYLRKDIAKKTLLITDQRI